MYEYYALTKFSSFIPRVIRIDDNRKITMYSSKAQAWVAAPDNISIGAMLMGDIESEPITEKQANEIIERRNFIRSENLKKR